MDDISVLFLDDEQNILNSLKRLFINEPFKIFTTTDHQEALAVIAKEHIKVVFSDERMPSIHGVEFLKMVKEQYPDIVRVLFTGYADITAAEEAINLGEVYRFINKPWNTQELKKTIYQAIDHYDLVLSHRNLVDITNKKNEELEILNRKLKAMYEMQKEFTSTVSHELRTPLASIKMAVDIVMSGTSGDISPDQEKFLGKAKSNVDRLNRLINDILDLTKLESGKTVLQIEENDMNLLLQEVVNLQEALAREKGLYLKISVNSKLPPFPFDKDKLNQVFSNLVSNAIKFTEQGGMTISVGYRPEHNTAEVCIKDTGTGIPEDDIPKLFQKFQQLGDPEKRQTGGTGLGLAICKEIISQHGGKIWVESKLGEGSAFYFILPIVERRKESI
jgi:signal transduction histidine kinase